VTSDDDFEDLERRPGRGGALVGALFAVVILFLASAGIVYLTFH